MFLLQIDPALANIFLMLALFGVMFFFFLRPQMQRQKQQASFGDSLEKGKDIVTTGGILGRINKIEGQIVTLQIAPNTFIRVTRTSISRELTDALATTLKDEVTNKA